MVMLLHAILKGKSSCCGKSSKADMLMPKSDRTWQNILKSWKVCRVNFSFLESIRIPLIVSGHKTVFERALRILSSIPEFPLFVVGFLAFKRSLSCLRKKLWVRMTSRSSELPSSASSRPRRRTSGVRVVRRGPCRFHGLGRVLRSVHSGRFFSPLRIQR